jgi:hypothetical protein
VKKVFGLGALVLGLWFLVFGLVPLLFPVPWLSDFLPLKKRSRKSRRTEHDRIGHWALGSGFWSWVFGLGALVFGSPFTIHHSPLTIHHSPFTIHHSPLTINNHSQITVYQKSRNIIKTVKYHKNHCLFPGCVRSKYGNGNERSNYR